MRTFSFIDDNHSEAEIKGSIRNSSCFQFVSFVVGYELILSLCKFILNA